MTDSHAIIAALHEERSLKRAGKPYCAKTLAFLEAHQFHNWDQYRRPANA